MDAHQSTSLWRCAPKNAGQKLCRVEWGTHRSDNITLKQHVNYSIILYAGQRSPFHQTSSFSSRPATYFTNLAVALFPSLIIVLMLLKAAWRLPFTLWNTCGA